MRFNKTLVKNMARKTLELYSVQNSSLDLFIEREYYSLSTITMAVGTR